MKNTIIALAASAVALGSVNAQTLANVISSDNATGLSEFDFGGGVIATLDTGDAILFNPSATAISTRNIDVSTQLAPDFYDITVVGGTLDNAILRIGDIDADSTYTLDFGSTPFSIGNFGSSSGDLTVTQSGSILTAQLANSGTGGDGFIELQFGSGFSAGSFTSTVTDVMGSGSNPSGIERISVSFTATPVPVPEPSSALLLGLSALGFLGRRKR